MRKTEKTEVSVRVFVGLCLLLTSASGAGPEYLADAVARIQPAVVSISVDKLVKETRSGSGGSNLAQVRVLGSGFAFDRTGYILTCNHVIADYDRIEVRFPDGTAFSGASVSVTGRDPFTDLAVLKVDAGRPLPAVELADSDSLRIGQWVAAVGTPFGLEGSATAGVVSGLSRWGQPKSSGPDFQEFIQTDALINPGNSGGPLVDMRGRVVGVASFTRGAGPKEQTGIGFATPSNLARQVAGQLVRYGVVRRGYLGISTQAVTERIRQALALDSDRGALVSSVAPASPASKSGFLPGDMVLKLNGEEVPDVRWLQNGLAAKAPGDTVRLEVLRRGKKHEVKAVLSAWPVAGTEPRRAPQPRNWLGFLVGTLDDAAKLRTNADYGVVVRAIEPASPADDAELMVGDVLVEINYGPVKDVKAFAAFAARLARHDRPVLFRVLRGRSAFYAAVGP